jgi:uncharacterized protein YkwD
MMCTLVLVLLLLGNSQGTGEVEEQALLRMTNAHRASNGLSVLEYDSRLHYVARMRAQQQLGLPALSHYDGSGQLVFVRLLTDAGVQYALAGENLASDSLVNVTPERIANALMQSPMHRRNILEKKFSRTGVGAVTNGKTIAFAQIFR